MLLTLVLALLAQAVPARSPASFDATKAVFSTPRQMMVIDAAKVKGAPVCLALTEDGSVFLRTTETDRSGNERAINYVAASPDAPFAKVDAAPDWSTAYWTWKAGSSAPGLPQMKFESESTTAGVLVPRSDSEASYQNVTKTTMKLKGQVIFEGESHLLVPGATFGWSPAPLGALAFVDAKKQLVVLDREGQVKGIDGAIDVLLPGWTDDGRRIFYLQKRDPKRFALMVVDVH
jgi:hypothetical protein